MMNRRVLSVVFVLSLMVPLLAVGSGMASIEDARRYAERKLLPLEGVAGVSQSGDKIIVYLEDAKYAKNVPDEIKGSRTEIRVIGRMEALGIAEPAGATLPASASAYHSPVNRTDRVRPVLGGISCGNPEITAGTLGIVTGDPYILSAAHVLAMDEDARFLKKGTPILQPGPYDGGALEDKIGELHKYIKIRFWGSGLIKPNYADAAIAELTTDEYLEREALGADNQSTYVISGTADVSVGDAVRKSGRTTGVTQSEVVDDSATVKVYYTPLKWAIFKDQILVEQPFCAGGDSGSLVDKNGKFIGLLFAGSEDVAVICKAKYIIEGLGISI
ncbi:MAG TPA: hypothetical protein ENF26_00275 [Methanomicrobia archaeon]|nr:hypothetical protein [Methanomicrobia archaeon]HEX58576.1 hypothetical protein [Methanomicrobia archaeon]